MSFKICQSAFDNSSIYVSTRSSTVPCRRREFIDAHSSHVSSRISLLLFFALCAKKEKKLDNLLLMENLSQLIAAALPGGNHNDSSSCSSGPESPNGQADGRTQYISATCVVVTHYSGDVASVVDEHFTRALNFNDKTSKGKAFLSIGNCCETLDLFSALITETCNHISRLWRRRAAFEPRGLSILLIVTSVFI